MNKKTFGDWNVTIKDNEITCKNQVTKAWFSFRSRAVKTLDKVIEKKIKEYETTPTAFDKKEKTDVYGIVNDRILDQLEHGIIPWERPWPGPMTCYNVKSKKGYSLMNTLLLGEPGAYGTFKQWSEIKGAKVKKGSKSYVVTFWRSLALKADESTDEKDGIRTIPMLRHYRVFHESQVEFTEGKPTFLEEPVPALLGDDRQELMEESIRKFLKIENIGLYEKPQDKAFYAPLSDSITIPTKEQFNSNPVRLATLAHETVHSTGHPSRLNRIDTVHFGDEKYSKEELVAETGSAYLMSYFGVETDKTARNTGAYLQSWIKVLKNDKKMFVSAASRAGKAVDFILSAIEPKKEDM